jgi:hypothetical protein
MSQFTIHTADSAPAASRDTLAAVQKKFGFLPNLLGELAAALAALQAYVTLNELDDILKITCPEKFSDKNLDPIIRKFSSLQNRILIDYKRFRQTIVDHPLYKNENMEFSGQKDEQKKREYLEARVNVSKHKSIEARENSGSRNMLQGSLSAMPLQESPSLDFHNIQAKTPIDIATYENSYVAQSVKKN